MAIISLVVGFFIGQQCKSIPDTVENQMIGQTFYATVENLEQKEDGVYVTVQGLNINESKYRGTFFFKANSAFVGWKDTQINILNLKKKTNISITFDGAVTKNTNTNLEEINGIIQIRVLEDEI